MSHPSSPERQRELVRQVALETGSSVYEGYSERGMYGAKCIGISCDNADEVVHAAGAEGLPIPKRDQLGKGYIVYWPDIPSDPKKI